MNTDDGQYHFTHIFGELLVPMDQDHWLENKLATLLLLRIVALPYINASHSSSVEKDGVSTETYTVSRIYWIKSEEHLDLLGPLCFSACNQWCDRHAGA